MELRHIRYFLAVAEERHFTRAAQRLGIGQPPLSHQIKDLEREVGTPLFHRIPQGAELTEAGRAFEAGVRQIPGLVGEAVVAAQRAAAGETGRIRVGFTGSAAFNPRVPQAIRIYRRRFPDVELSLAEHNSIGLVEGLKNGSLDAAFLRPDAVDKQGLRLFHLADEPLIAALASARMPHGEPIRLEQLAEDAFILTPRALGPTLFDATLEACRRAGFEAILGQSAPQVASVLALVAAELGVALVPESMRDASFRGVTYHDLTGNAPKVALALATRNDEQAATVAAFVAEARFPSEAEPG
ncbi:DNA-binding transcriptional LysR family regulator [Novosphingobium sp. PhB57]|jgi:DNA-binding transcriptional LysR family regulator|uniref:LysR family transcriptional regulator n=1 Tax=unclassified Novosphingobium TaxID=2644732 RepID=UPI0010463861|nr:LysR family transcriptional regulator [Novosphingobium sp. PhB57]TCU58683.1 DNA-binding transcriptional LysR family regulator [Novosphingobium sp. PhB57]